LVAISGRRRIIHEIPCEGDVEYQTILLSDCAADPASKVAAALNKGSAYNNCLAMSAVEGVVNLYLVSRH
jgi:hypothetical protein